MAPVRYDAIGRDDALNRREDPVLRDRIHAALGGAGSVLNVGSGTGSYEPRDRLVGDLRRDIEDGSWDRRHGGLRHLDEFDAGMRLVVARSG